MTDELLIVEDDPGTRSGLVRALTNAGYACRPAPDAAAARAVVDPPGLVLLDLGLPDADGLDLARELHDRWPDVPIVMVTARAEEMDVVVGLDSGAIDYVTKPFRLAELLARIRAHLRRPAPAADAPALVGAGVIVDLGARIVRLDGEEISLRAKEFDLLVALMSNQGNVVTREELMAQVWDEHWFGSTKTLDVHISSLRRRLGEGPGEPSRITALRGVGYRWERDA
ncbi:MAG TPA: response regulator transcription factor [Microthrixaceae bacterium]|nr:response regulator transcription factor [Microthrixaceae bacterium]